MVSRSVVYLLADTQLCGGVKVALRHAELLAARGHDVTVVSPGPQPDWSSGARFLQVPSLEEKHLPVADLTVATFWTTIEPALSGHGAVAHFCQGFEGGLTHNETEHPAILRAYRQPLPGLVVAPHLRLLLRQRFARPSRVIPQPLEAGSAPDLTRTRPREIPRIVVTGPFEVYLKGVAVALEAVRLLRLRGLDARLIRVSQWPQTDDEKHLLEADTFHCHLPPSSVPEVLRDADLLIAPSWAQEGFGLPVLEAMACGVPVVASDIPAMRDFATGAARLVPFDDAGAFANAAEETLRDTDTWRSMRRAGLEVASGFGDEPCANALEEAIEWILSGAWRTEG